MAQAHPFLCGTLAFASLGSAALLVGLRRLRRALPLPRRRRLALPRRRLLLPPCAELGGALDLRRARRRRRLAALRLAPRVHLSVLVLARGGAAAPHRRRLRLLGRAVARRRRALARLLRLASLRLRLALAFRRFLLPA